MHGIKRLAKNLLQEVLLRGQLHFSGARRSGAVYLTFDDGPDPRYTGRVLDILGRFGAKASFYLVGSRAEEHPELARRIVSEGHAVGNHTYSHAVAPDFESEVDRAARAIGAAARYRGTLTFRPPRGIITPRLLYMVKKRGLTMVCWNIDSEDWRRESVGAIRENVWRRDVRGGDVILFHDNNELTVRALPRILEELRAKRLAFATVDELAPCAKARGELDREREKLYSQKELI